MFNNVVVSHTFATVSKSLTETVTPPSPHSSSPLQNISPSILIIVTVLAVTVIVSFALCFLLRHLNRRCLRRLSSDPDAFPPPVVISGRTSPEIIPPSDLIDSLPLFTFSSVTRRSSTAAADCAVCLSKFHNNDLLRLLPRCCHAFHVDCIDTWLRSNLSCPLCRSAVFPSDSDLAKILRSPSSDSFRIEIGNVSRRGTIPDAAGDGRSFSMGSFDYYVEEPSEVSFTHDHRRSISDHKVDIPTSDDSPAINETVVLAGEVGSSGFWLKDYVDRLSASISSRTASFRSSGRFFGGSSRRNDVVQVAVDYDDVESNRIGEEITEMFRWLSGV